MWILAALTAATAVLVRRFGRRGAEATSRVGIPVLLVAAFGVAVTQAIVLAALPVFGRQFGVSAATAAWLLTGFMLAAAVATPVAGRLGDLYGYRRVMVTSLLVLVAGSVLAAVADHAGSFGGLLLGRVVQGLSAGVFPVAFGLARRIVPANRLPGVVAGLSAMFGVGGAFGMVLAGPLVDVFGTPILFWLSVGLGIVALAGAAAVREPVAPGAAGSLDFRGALLLSGILVAVLIVVSQGRTWGWGAPATLATTGAATGINTILRTVGGAAGAQIAATIITGSVAPSTGLPTEGGFVTAFLVAAGGALVAVVVAGAIPNAVPNAVPSARR
jgi:MFS family permease